MLRSRVPRLEFRSKRTDARREQNPFTGEALVVPIRPEQLRFFEAEIREDVVCFASGGTELPTRQWQTSFESEDEAYFAYAMACAAKQRRGYVFAGPASEIDGSTPEQPGSSVLLEVYFAAGDPRFLSELLRARGTKKLGALAANWFHDQRPFARQMLLAYIDDGCGRPEHKALVKRLFKAAEAAKDHALMARFLVAFDRWNRRTLQTVGYRWDPVMRGSVREFGLREDPLVAESLTKGEETREFSRATRRYLMRRALRYFRHLGHQDASQYRSVIVQALKIYREEHLNTVGRLLGSWGLMHLLYGRSTVLKRHPRGIRLAQGGSLDALTPMPWFPELWAEAFTDLLELLMEAGSRTVRAWALALLHTSHPERLRQLTLAQIKALLVAKNDEAQALGVELFNEQGSLEELSITDWLQLLAVENLEVLAAVCDRAVLGLNGAALSLEQCVVLTLSSAAPLAQLGFAFCRTKKITSESDLATLLRVTQAKVEAVRTQAASYCGELLGSLPFATLEQVRDLCDSRYRDVRAAGLQTAQARFAERIDLWTALCESPYPEVRSHVVKRAGQFRAESPRTMNHLFGTVLLSLQGAAKDKRRVAKEMVERIGVRPEEARLLLPMLGAVLRSIHPVERGFALGALTQMALKNEAVRALAAEEFPEFSLSGAVSE